MGSRLRLAGLIAVVGLLFSVPARADQITLTGGLLDVSVTTGATVGGLVRLVGDRGFSFSGFMNGSAESPIGNPLIPGTPITFEAGATGLDLGGTAALDGITYSDVGGLTSPVQAALRFVTSPTTLPPVLNPPSQMIAPFMLDFIFEIGTTSHLLSGAGTATLFLGEDLGFGVPSWRVTRVRAELSDGSAPVPEPTTFLLVGAGLGWAARRRLSRDAR